MWKLSGPKQISFAMSGSASGKGKDEIASTGSLRDQNVSDYDQI